jgi:hypothetical protein
MPHRVSIWRTVRVREKNQPAARKQLQKTSGDDLLPAWVQNASSTEVIEHQKRDQFVTHRVFFNVKPEIKKGDEVLVESGPSFVNIRIENLALTERTAGLGRTWRMMGGEVNNPRTTFDSEVDGT